MRSLAFFARSIRLAAPWMLAATALALQGDDGTGGGGCPTAVEPDPFPPVKIEGTFVGFTDSGYSKVDLPVPGPIPLGFYATDQDSVLLKCGPACVPVYYGVPISGMWGVSVATAGSAGVFLDHDANQVGSIMDSVRVLYLPPGDLTPDSTRTCIVTAAVLDECGPCDDPRATVEFHVLVKRKSNGLYDVTVTPKPPDNPDFDPKPCISDATSDCDLLTNRQIQPQPTVGIKGCSEALVGEWRPMHAMPQDTDWIIGECGTPPGVYPVIHNSITAQLCDSFTYLWEVTPQPGETGMGYFVAKHSRSPFFVATRPGPVTVKVTATTSDGEFNHATKVVTIHKPLLRRLAFNTATDIIADVPQTPQVPTIYSAPHWHDINGNGVASELNERRFPVAFKASAPITLSKLELDAPIRAMPGMSMLGIVQGEAAMAFTGWSFSYGPTLPNGQWWTTNFTSTNATFATCRYFNPMTIDWSNGPLGCTASEFIGRTDNKAYVTMGSPLGGTLGATNHSVFEIACKDSNGLSDVGALTNAIWTTMKAASVQRVTPDGFNKPVTQVPLTYWADPNSLCNDVRNLLHSGDGTCSAWAQFLACCLHLQSIPIAPVQVLAPGGLSQHLTRLYIRKWIVATPAAYQYQNFHLFQTVGGVTDDAGIPGKGNNNPRSVFSNHFMIASGTTLYDASYVNASYAGWPGDASKIAWEKAALFAQCPNINAPGVNVFADKPNAVDLVWQ